MKWNIRELKSRSAALVEEKRDSTRSLVLLYCGVVAAIMLGTSGLNVFLNNRIDGTGGLGGLGTRSVLQTIQEILTYGNLFFTPFWSMGFLSAMIALTKGMTPWKRHMKVGFRYPGKILTYICVQFLVTVMLMVVSVNVGVTLYSLTPMGAEYADVMGPILSDPGIISPEGVVNWELLPVDTFMSATMPVMAVCLVIFAALYIFVSYCFRLTMYLILDMTSSFSTVRLFFLSARLMRGHKWQMLKLDLSWWWYYLLLSVASVVAYLDVILGLLGISVPVDPMVMFFATVAAYCVLFTALSLWKKCQVDASYVLAFESIAAAAQVEVPAQAE